MANKDIKIIQENDSGDFVLATITTEANKIIGFDSSQNPVMKQLNVETVVTSVSSIASIDCSLGSFYTINISASDSISLSNVVTGRIYYLMIKNTGASSITITLPNTADVKASATTTIAASKYKEFSFISDGTTRYWQISEELT